MLGTFAAAALLGAGALLVGQALCVLLRGATAPYGGAIGLAALLILATAAIRLPGDAVTAVVLCGLLCAASAVVLARHGTHRPGAVGVAVGAITGAGISLPFLANGRVGLLGVSLNNDTSLHLLWAEGLRDDRIRALAPSPDNYPLGPHALVATLAQATGTSMDLAFTALLIIIPVLTALAALSALRGVSVTGRLIAAPLTGLVYLAAAYAGQGAFKETIVGCFLLAFVVVLDDIGRGDRERVRAREALLLAVPAAATLYAFSYAGIAWPLGALAIWLLLDLLARQVDGGIRAVRARVRGLLPAVVLGGAAIAVLVIPEASHLLSFLRSANGSATGASSGGIAAGNLGNLIGPLPIWESLGVWLGPDFRIEPPRGPFNTGAWSAIAAAATVFGACALLARRRFALPAALAVCTLIYWRSHTAGDSPYVTAKALVIAAPVAMTTAGAGLWQPLADLGSRAGGVRLARAVLVAAFTVTAAWSSFTVLRGAQVAPLATRDELASLRPLLGHEPTLFLGNDDYYAWKLRGVPAGEPAYTTPIAVDLRPEKAYVYPQPRDFDTVTPATLDRFTYVITPRSPYQSEAPANLRRVRSTRLFTLWRRTGPTRSRDTLPGEVAAPGAILDCSTAAGRALARTSGVARVMPAPVAISGPPGGLRPGRSSTVPVKLPPGRWTLSMPYLGPQDVTVRVGDLAARLPANLDRPGAVYELGTVTVPDTGGPRAMTFTIDDPAPPGLRSPMHIAYAGNVLATRAGLRRSTVALRSACGRYVDWYRPG